MSKPLNEWRKCFFKDVLWLILSIQGRLNFLQFSRYGNFSEQRYRQQFEKEFDFLDFNLQLFNNQQIKDAVIAFDPSYIPKSGKQTHGVGYFWSGCANSSKWGLEIGGIAAIDLENHTALHLEAVQTALKPEQTLLEYYSQTLIDRKESLQKISNIVVADAYFSKAPFVDALTNEEFQIVSRLRDDARLEYILKPQPTGKPGRPKTRGEKVDIKNPDKKVFTCIKTEDNSIKMYTTIVKAVALKRKIRIVIVQSIVNGKVNACKVFFSTDIEMDALRLIEIYQSRFQIEFLYRDAKQYTGLTHCQARDENKLYFHFNMTLTAVNIAKIAHWYNIPKEERKTFSMANIKVMNHNILLLERFFQMYGIKPNILKNKPDVKELILYGTKCA